METHFQNILHNIPARASFLC